MVTETKLSPEEARELILAGEHLMGCTITRSLFLTGDIIPQRFNVEGATFEKSLILENASCSGSLHFSGATIEEDLSLAGMTIGGDLYLDETIIQGRLDLSTKSGPKRIFVSPKMAERIHRAAPNIPLVEIPHSH